MTKNDLNELIFMVIIFGGLWAFFSYNLDAKDVVLLMDAESHKPAVTMQDFFDGVERVGENAIETFKSQ